MAPPQLHIEPTFSRHRIRTLLQEGTPPHVSLFMPTHRAWNQTKANRLTLRSLLRDAQTGLYERGLSKADAGPLLQPARDLVDKDAFWREDADGLALFLAQGHFSSYRLPFSPPPRQFIDRRFHLRPLWRHLEPDGVFYLLALAQDGVKLFRASRYTLHEVELTGVPASLEEALQFDEHSRSVLFHTRTPPGAAGDPLKRAAIYYGQEDAGDKTYVKEGILRFFQAIDEAVRRVLGHEATPPPLVLAGVAYIRGLYRKASHYRHLAEASVEGALINGEAEHWDVEALHTRAWSIVQPYFDQHRQDAVARYRQLSAAAPDWTAGTIETVLPAAYDYRIDTLFVTEEATVWGRYNPASHAVTTHPTPAPADTELMNAAVAQVLLGGGTVYVGDPADLPDAHPIVATLRY